MSQPSPLPLAARRAAWDRLWQILLAPVPECEPGSSAEQARKGSRQASDLTGERQ
jgi:hypothetical protein